MTDFAAKISPDTAGALMALCAEANPHGAAVDLGTGEGGSLAVLLRALWTRIYSVDNDSVFFDVARRTCKEVGFDTQHVQFVHAPLEPYRGSKALWYAVAAMDRIETPISLLFVDGPAGSVGRGPAIPELLPKMHVYGIILLDDCRRPGEAAVFNAWESLVAESGRPYTAYTLPTERGLGVIKLGRWER